MEWDLGGAHAEDGDEALAVAGASSSLSERMGMRCCRQMKLGGGARKERYSYVAIKGTGRGRADARIGEEGTLQSGDEPTDWARMDGKLLLRKMRGVRRSGYSSQRHLGPASTVQRGDGTQAAGCS